MSFLKFTPILVGIGLFTLVVPFNIGHSQITIYSSEGTKVIGEREAESGTAGTQTKAEGWHLVYEPGERQAENRQRQPEDVLEQQKKIAAEKAYRDKRQQQRVGVEKNKSAVRP
jgi:hypothetical protein